MASLNITDKDDKESKLIRKKKKKIRKRLSDFFRSTRSLKRLIFGPENTSHSDGPDKLEWELAIKEYPLSREDPTPWEEDPQNVYDFGYPSRGLAVLFLYNKFDIVQYNREGAEYDAIIFRRIFESLGFDVRIYWNLATYELEDVLTDLRTNQIKSNMDCFVCGISSHGAANPDKGREKRTTHYFFTRDSTMPTGDVVENFSDDHCPQLKGKPKIFFIQACRSLFRGERKTDHGRTILVKWTQPLVDEKALSQYFSSAWDPKDRNSMKIDAESGDTTLRSQPDARPENSEYNKTEILFEFPTEDSSDEETIDSNEDEQSDDREEMELDQMLSDILAQLTIIQETTNEISLLATESEGSSQKQETTSTGSENTSDPNSADALGKITPHGSVSTKTREYVASNSPHQLREVTPVVLAAQQNICYRPFTPNGEELLMEQFLKNLDNYDYCHIPSDKDFLLMFSSAPDFVAWRNIGSPGAGSWLFLALSNALNEWEKSAFSGDFLSFLTTVCHQMTLMETGEDPQNANYSFCKSTAYIYHQMCKDVFFLPKIPQYITHS